MRDQLFDGVPVTIREFILGLPKKFEISGRSDKGANGYLFFAKDKFLGRDVAIKFYFWGENKEAFPEPQNLVNLGSEYTIEILEGGIVDEE